MAPTSPTNLSPLRASITDVSLLSPRTCSCVHSESESLTPWDTKRPPMHSDQVFPASQVRSPSTQGAGGDVASSAVWGDGRARESAGSTRRRIEDVNFMVIEVRGGRRSRVLRVVENSLELLYELFSINENLIIVGSIKRL